MIFYIFKNFQKISIGLRSDRENFTTFFCQITSEESFEKLAESESFDNFSDFSKRLVELKIDLKEDQDYERICECLKNDKKWDLQEERIKTICAPLLATNIGETSYFISPLPIGNLSRTAQALGDDQLVKWGCFPKNCEDKTILIEFSKKELIELDRLFILRENNCYNIYDLAKIELANLTDFEEIGNFNVFNIFKNKENE